MSKKMTQADRSARTCEALIVAAARGLSRYGYSNLVLEQVASEAGCSRGALYHQFADKEDLAMAVLVWVNEIWEQEVLGAVEAYQESDPGKALIKVARAHAVFCRRDVARVIMALRLEFSGRDHPIGHEIEKIYTGLVERCARLVREGRKAGSIPPGPSAKSVGLAFVGAVEGAVIQMTGREPDDEILAARAAAGVLGLKTPETNVKPRGGSQGK